MKTLSFFQLSLMLTGISLFLFSLWKVYFNADYFPYLFLTFSSLICTVMFLANYLTRDQSKTGLARTLISLIAVLLLFACYFSPELLRNFYPLILWNVIAVLLSSVQGILEHYRKRHYQNLRYLNYGLILVLLPPLIMKFEEDWIWTGISILTSVILLIDLVYFLLPKSQIGQSK